MGADDAGRARRKELELWQGRLKEAHEDLELAHTEGYPEELKRLLEDTLAVETDAVLHERKASDTKKQLEKVRHDVEEAERQLLAPKTVSSVSPVTVLVALSCGVASLMTLIDLIRAPPTVFGYALMGLLGVVPAPVLAWIWRRRFSGGGTFRSPP